MAGIGSHLLDTMVAVDRAQLDCDFYFKTFNSGNNWSASPAVTPDSN